MASSVVSGNPGEKLQISRQPKDNLDLYFWTYDVGVCQSGQLAVTGFDNCTSIAAGS